MFLSSGIFSLLLILAGLFAFNLIALLLKSELIFSFLFMLIKSSFGISETIFLLCSFLLLLFLLFWVSSISSGSIL